MSPIIIVAIVVVILLIALGVGVYFMMGSSDSSTLPPSGTLIDTPAGPVMVSQTSAPASEKYYLAQTCPTGWSNVGRVGILGKSDSIFTKGAQLNRDWYWVHPQLCKGSGSLDGLYGFNGGPYGNTGVIGDNSALPPFAAGAKYGDKYTWTHPTLAPASSAQYSIGNGNAGRVGIIYNNGSAAAPPFTTGPAYNKDWTWMYAPV